LSQKCGHDASNGVPRVARKLIEARSLPWKIAQSVLYDTLIHGFWSGYFNEPHGAEPFDPVLHEAAVHLMELAIIVMANFVA